METKKLSNLVIDFFRNDIVWLVFYLAFAATVVERSITWLFFSDFAGGMTLRVVLGLWSTGLILGILFSVWLWLAIAANTFRTVMGKLMICLLMLGLLCNWVFLYAVAYAYLGLIDGERLVREPTTCLYFSIVTWTTLGYGDVRPSMDARFVAGSEALLGYIWMAFFIGMFAVLFKQPAEGTSRF
jgi:hypothetical protein